MRKKLETGMIDAYVKWGIVSTLILVILIVFVRYFGISGVYVRTFLILVMIVLLIKDVLEFLHNSCYTPGMEHFPFSAMVSAYGFYSLISGGGTIAAILFAIALLDSAVDFRDDLDNYSKRHYRIN